MVEQQIEELSDDQQLEVNWRLFKVLIYTLAEAGALNLSRFAFVLDHHSHEVEDVAVMSAFAAFAEQVRREVGS